MVHSLIFIYLFTCAYLLVSLRCTRHSKACSPRQRSWVSGSEWHCLFLLGMCHHLYNHFRLLLVVCFNRRQHMNIHVPRSLHTCLIIS